MKLQSNTPYNNLQNLITINKRFVFFLIAVLVIWSVFGFKTNISKVTSVAVIISSDNPFAFDDNPTLSVSDVKSYFLRKPKRRWPQTNNIILPVDRIKFCPEQELFYLKILNMNTWEVENYFLQKQYQNGDRPPDRFSTDKEIIDFVGDEIGAIGYVNVNSLTTEAKTKVKVVLIINN